MANDSNRQDPKHDDLGGKQTGKADRKRVIGEGMNSLDSTQVPLSAETGLPDWDAVNGKIPKEESEK
jgi:hypothetical protein